MCAAQQLRRYYDPEDLYGEEWELNDEEIAAPDLRGAASPVEVEGGLPDMNAEEMAKCYGFEQQQRNSAAQQRANRKSQSQSR